LVYAGLSEIAPVRFPQGTRVVYYTRLRPETAESPPRALVSEIIYGLAYAYEEYESESSNPGRRNHVTYAGPCVQTKKNGRFSLSGLGGSDVSAEKMEEYKELLVATRLDGVLQIHPKCPGTTTGSNREIRRVVLDHPSEYSLPGNLETPGFFNFLRQLGGATEIEYDDNDDGGNGGDGTTKDETQNNNNDEDATDNGADVETDPTNNNNNNKNQAILLVDRTKGNPCLKSYTPNEWFKYAVWVASEDYKNNNKEKDNKGITSVPPQQQQPQQEQQRSIESVVVLGERTDMKFKGKIVDPMRDFTKEGYAVELNKPRTYVWEKILAASVVIAENCGIYENPALLLTKARVICRTGSGVIPTEWKVLDNVEIERGVAKKLRKIQDNVCK